MITKEELDARKEDAEPLNTKFHELTDEELAQVSGGDYWDNSVKKTCSNDSATVNW